MVTYIYGLIYEGWQTTSAVHTEAYIKYYRETIISSEHYSGSWGNYEVQGLWIGEHYRISNINILELIEVRLTLQEFSENCII